MLYCAALRSAVLHHAVQFCCSMICSATTMPRFQDLSVDLLVAYVGCTRLRGKQQPGFAAALHTSCRIPLVQPVTKLQQQDESTMVVLNMASILTTPAQICRYLCGVGCRLPQVHCSSLRKTRQHPQGRASPVQQPCSWSRSCSNRLLTWK